jgi:hypothetical protein
MTEHFDYFDKLQGMKEADLLTEITLLNKKFYSIQRDSAIQQQLGNMIDMAQQQLSMVVAQRQSKDKDEPEVMNIGEIEEKVDTPDYSKQELITYFKRFYSGDKPSQNEGMDKPITGNRKTTPTFITPVDRPIKSSGGKPDVGDIPVFGAKK